MKRIRPRRFPILIALVVAMCASAVGCRCQPKLPDCPAKGPRECEKTLLPEYVIEPPDILLIDALYVVPLPPYKVRSMDALAIRVPKAIAEEPIAGIYPVDPDGSVNLGLSYGTIKVAGMTLTEAKAAIEKQLTTVGLKDPRAEVAVAESRGLQQIRGQHLVRPDGTVSLGSYGSVQVTGLTLNDAKAAIEAHLAQYLQSPEVSVDVTAYNSKVFYVIYDGAGSGQQIYRLPVTGNETVLDAVSQLNGLSAVADLKKIWVARPNCDGKCDQLMPVDWCAITARGRPETNYQLKPGDRLYVQSSRFVTADTRLARFLAPFERIIGFTLLENSAIRSFGNNRNNQP